MKILVEMPVGWITDSFLSPDNVRFLESLGDVTWNRSENHLTPEQFRDALADVDVCVCGWGVPRFDAYVLEKANRLKLIAYTAGSVARVVTDEMYDRGIRIVCGNEAFAQSVAEGTIAYIMASLRRLRQYERHMAEHGWKPADFQTEGLTGRTVGIVGYGAISRYLLELLRPFRVRIKLFSRHMTAEQASELGVEKAELEEIFSACDIISLHCAKNPANYHLIDDRLLGMMKGNALLVNTARGNIIDQEALVKHLATGRIRAALDVFEAEPLPMDSPLRHMDNVLLQPHMGGPTMDRRPAAARLALEDIKRLQDNIPLENEIVRWRSKMMTM